MVVVVVVTMVVLVVFGRLRFGHGGVGKLLSVSSSYLLVGNGVMGRQGVWG